MATANTPNRTKTYSDDARTVNGHDFVLVSEWLRGKPPSNVDSEIFDAHEYETRYFRCRKCGQERNRAAEFVEVCSVERLSNPVTDGGYTIEEGRTRRALTEDMTVRFGELGPRYRVDSESGRTYVVVGTHGRTEFDRYLLGSVTEYLVRTAPIPVLTVRPPEEAT